MNISSKQRNKEMKKETRIFLPFTNIKASLVELGSKSVTRPKIGFISSDQAVKNQPICKQAKPAGRVLCKLDQHIIIQNYHL